MEGAAREGELLRLLNERIDNSGMAVALLEEDAGAVQRVSFCSALKRVCERVVRDTGDA